MDVSWLPCRFSQNRNTFDSPAGGLWAQRLVPESSVSSSPWRVLHSQESPGKHTNVHKEENKIIKQGASKKILLFKNRVCFESFIFVIFLHETYFAQAVSRKNIIK